MVVPGQPGPCTGPPASLASGATLERVWQDVAAFPAAICIGGLAIASISGWVANPSEARLAGETTRAAKTSSRPGSRPDHKAARLAGKNGAARIVAAAAPPIRPRAQPARGPRGAG